MYYYRLLIHVTLVYGRASESSRRANTTIRVELFLKKSYKTKQSLSAHGTLRGKYPQITHSRCPLTLVPPRQVQRQIPAPTRRPIPLAILDGADESSAHMMLVEVCDHLCSDRRLLAPRPETRQRRFAVQRTRLVVPLEMLAVGIVGQGVEHGLATIDGTVDLREVCACDRLDLVLGAPRPLRTRRGRSRPIGEVILAVEVGLFV